MDDAAFVLKELEIMFSVLDRGLSYGGLNPRVHKVRIEELRTELCNRRLAAAAVERREARVQLTAAQVASSFSVVYHIAAMNHWRLVVAEQVPVILANKRIAGIYLSVAGMTPDDEEFIQSTFGCSVEIAERRSTIDECEHPAMLIVDRLAGTTEYPILYLHTKGVSRDDQLNAQWRRHMNAFVAEGDKWAGFLAASGAYNTCGPLLYHETRSVPEGVYFAGNFWMARSDYMRSLTPYQQMLPNPCHSNRHFAEGAVNRNNTLRPFATDGTDLRSVPELVAVVQR